LEEIGAIAVDSKVAVGWESRGLAAAIGDGGAGEVEGILVGIEDQFDDVGIGKESTIIKGATGGDHGEALIVAKLAGEGIDEGGIEERFVTLNVNNVGSGMAPGGGFSDAVGASGVIGAGADGTGIDGFAEADNAVVVCCDDQFIKFPAPGSSFKNVLKERFSEEGMEGLSGEAGRGPAGRDDTNDSCFFVVYMNPP